MGPYHSPLLGHHVLRLGCLMTLLQGKHGVTVLLCCLDMFYNFHTYTHGICTPWASFVF